MAADADYVEIWDWVTGTTRRVYCAKPVPLPIAEVTQGPTREQCRFRRAAYKHLTAEERAASDRRLQADIHDMFQRWRDDGRPYPSPWEDRSWMG